MPVVIEMTVAEGLTGSGAVDDGIPDARQLEQWAQAASDTDDAVIVSVKIVDAGEMQALNRTWRGRNRPTNVLSFPSGAAELQLPAEAGLNLLGDLALCPGVIRDEAQQQHKSLRAHWAHMVVHGMLHLQGYDHAETAAAEQMQARETAILARLGLDNPYQHTRIDTPAGTT